MFNCEMKYLKGYLWCIWFVAFHIISSSAEICKIHSTSPTCRQLHQIELSLDDNIDPCEDFYGYACNNWSLQQLNTAYNDTIGLVDYQMNLKMITILESLYQQEKLLKTLSKQNQSIFDKTYIYYISCVRETTHNVLHYFQIVKPGKNLEWPVIEYRDAYLKGERNALVWPKQPFDMFALLGQLQSYGLNNVLINHSKLRRSNGILYIWLLQPTAEDYDILPTNRIKDLLTNWGLPKEWADSFVQHMLNLHEFWHAKYKIKTDEDVARFTYLEMKEQFPQLSAFVSNMLSDGIQDNDKILVGNVKYIQYLINLVLNEEQQKNICHYLMVKFMTYMWNGVKDDFTKLECIKDLRNKLDLSANLLYYEHILQTEDLVATSFNYNLNQLFNNSRHYLATLIGNNNLMLSKSERQQLLYQLDNLFLNIGNFPRNLLPSRIEQLHWDIPQLELGNYYKNRLHLMQHCFRKTLLLPEEASYYTITDYRTGIYSTPFYAAEQDMIMLPLGALEPPIYHHTFPPIFKWSSLVLLLAESLTHVVAPRSDQLKLAFKDDFRPCMETQEIPDHNDVDFLAYLVAARVSYEGYRNEYKNQLQPNFTSIPWQKLFYINLSQFFCGPRIGRIEDRNPYPKYLRKIAMNLESFAEAFQCTQGSKMNPAKKCRFY